MFRKRTTRRVWLRGSAAACASSFLRGVATAADAYPDRPVRIFVPSAAGSGTDNGVRQVANFVTQKRGWNFVVENRPGANGFLAAQAVKRATADGYTILGASSTLMSYNPVAFKSLPYDSIKDFDPIIRTVMVPHVAIAAPKYHLNTISDLIALLRRQPFVYAVYGANRPVAERFLQMLKLSGVAVPYKTNPEAVVAVIGGQVDFMFVDLAIAAPLLKGGEIKALAVTSDKRLDSMPNVPTMKESGFANFESTAWAGFFAPKGTPIANVNLLHRAFLDFYETASGRAYVSSVGGYFADIAPTEFRQWMASEIETTRTIYLNAGIQPE